MHHPARSQAGTEADLYRAWESLSLPCTLTSANPIDRIVLLFPGHRNVGPGPDFADALLLLNGELVVGPVEMHCRESDWHAHAHGGDPAYDPVILHVLQSDIGYRRDPDIPGVILDAARHPVQGQFRRTGGTISVPEDLHDLRSLLHDSAWQRFFRRTARYVAAIDRTDLFCLQLFDVLGYFTNRKPMRRVARHLLAEERASTPLELLGMVRSLAGLEPSPLFDELGTAPSLAPSVVPRSEWDLSVRPGNHPTRRLIAACVLTTRLCESDLASATNRALLEGAPTSHLVDLWRVHASGETFLGDDRVSALFVNAILPRFVAEAIVAGQPNEIASLLRRYERWPGASSNRRVRKFERMYCRHLRLRGAFLQQGAIEFLASLEYGSAEDPISL